MIYVAKTNACSSFAWMLSYKQKQTWPRGYKTFFVLNSTEHEISTAHKKLKYRQMKKFLALSLSGAVFNRANKS